MVALKRFRQSDPSFADLVPYAGLVDNGIMLLKDGSLMAGWYFAGPDSESSTDAERNEVSRQINAILSRLGSGWMIQVEAARVPTTEYLDEADCHFPDPITRAIDAEPRRSGLTRYVYADAGSRSATYADSALDAFRTSIREVEQYLANVVTIQRMVTDETEERRLSGGALRRTLPVHPLLRHRREPSGASARNSDVPRLAGHGRASARPDADCRKPLPRCRGDRRPAGGELAGHPQRA
ncbi:hypothetical protein QO004_004800 [Rhizobium mesoamericanum]|nr:hypothetical protein [Rhizobium mesoamericanum]